MTNLRLVFIFSNESIIHNQNGVYFHSSITIPMGVPNDYSFETFNVALFFLQSSYLE